MQEIRFKIEENRKKLQKLLQNKDNQKVLDKWLKTELAYTSNAIEGNTLTRRETELAIEEQITTGAKPINDYLEARNHANAFDFICHTAKNKVKIDENYVLQIHKIILSGIDDTNAGFYPAYHMNKKNWISIFLNDTAPDDFLFELLDESHNFTLKKQVKP